MHPGSKWYAFWMLVNIIQKQGNENKYGQPFKKCKKKMLCEAPVFKSTIQSQQVSTYILTLTFYPTYTVVYLMYFYLFPYVAYLAKPISYLRRSG